MTKLRKLVKHLSPLLFISLFALLTFVFFWKVFLKGLMPIPADITVGLYFPWLDYKWGFPTGVPVKNPLPSDIPSLVYPWRMFVIDSLKSGVLPLWNPYYFSGMPLLANFQSAVFSLSNIFFLFLPETWAWSAGVIAQPFLAMIFAFLFLRNLKLSRLASILGGVVFAFSGFSFMWLEYNVHGWTAMWLPLLLLVVDKIIEKKNLRWVLGGSFILAIQIFAGYPQIVLYSATAIGFYSIFRLFFWKVAKNFKSLIKPILLLILFSLVGVLLAAAQILPGWEALKLSVREIDPIAQSSSGGFFPWQNLVTFLAPDFFGNPATYNFWGKPWYDNFALYVGILPLILATFAIFLRRDKLSWFFTFLAIFALLLALPNPVARWVNEAGIYGVKAIPARIIFLLDFSLAILAALGLEWLLACYHVLKHKNRKRKQILVILSSFSIAIFGLWLFVLTAGRFFPQAEWLVNLSVAQRNLILPTGLFLISSLILGCWLFFKNCQTSNFRLLAITLILLLSVADLFRFGWKYLPFSKPDLVFPSTPVIEFLQKQEKPFRVEFGETIPQNMWMPYGLESAAGYDAMAPLRYSQFLGALRTGRVDTPYGRVAQVENYDSRLFDLLNIKYVLAVKYDEKGIRNSEGKPRAIFQNPKFKLVFEDKTVQVYENLDVLPRAFLVDDFIVKKDNQKIIDQMLAPGFDLSQFVVVEEKINFKKEELNSLSAFLKEKEEAVFIKYQPLESIIKTVSEDGGLLFIGDNYYPGWKAFIDGKETKIYRANFTFRAVLVPAGEHEVKLTYQPFSFRLGLFISVSILAIIIATLTVIFLIKTAPNIIGKIFEL